MILLETMAFAVPVEIGLRLFPLDTVIAGLRHAPRSRRQRPPLDLARVARLVERAGSFYPLKATCLKKSLVLMTILRRRGFSPELRLGVKKADDEFSSHAWIVCEGETFLDAGISHQYTPMPLPLAED